MNTVNDYSVTIIKDDGTYSGAKWLAFDVDIETLSNMSHTMEDIKSAAFWKRYDVRGEAWDYVNLRWHKLSIGKGSSPDLAMADLKRKRCNSIDMKVI